MFLEDQVALLKIHINNMNEKWFIQDRVATVETMQVITELLITIDGYDLREIALLCRFNSQIVLHGGSAQRVESHCRAALIYARWDD